MSGRRARAVEELRALFDEVADIDWRAPSWRAWLHGLAVAEAWGRAELSPGLAAAAFEAALRASSGPVADTFMASPAPPAPDDHAGRVALAAARAVVVARALRELDHTAPGQRLVKALRRRGGWLEDAALEGTRGVGIAFLTGDSCVVTQVDAGEPHAEARIRERLLSGGLRPMDPGAPAPTPAAAAISLAPVPRRWARSFHRAAWSRGGGPWMGVADSPPYEVVSTCHAAIDGYAHARISAEVLRGGPGTHATPAPDPFTGAVGVDPPPVGFVSRVIEPPTPRFAAALYAFGAVLDRHLGDGGRRTVTFQVPLAPGDKADASRWRRRPLYGLLALQRVDGALETPEAFSERLPAFLEREASGRGLLTRALVPLIELPLPRSVRRALIASRRMDEWFPPARVLSGAGYFSWMRFPEGEEPRLPTFPSAIPSFSVTGSGGAGLSIARFRGGLAVGLTTSGELSRAARAEAFLDEWIEALRSARRRVQRTA